MKKEVPKFKEKTFLTHVAFELWLINTTYRQILLQDKGQDMQLLHVHESGEILEADFSRSIYAGRFIDMTKLTIGVPLEISDGNKFLPYRGLVVEEIRNSTGRKINHRPEQPK